MNSLTKQLSFFAKVIKIFFIIRVVNLDKTARIITLHESLILFGSNNFSEQITVNKHQKQDLLRITTAVLKGYRSRLKERLQQLMTLCFGYLVEYLKCCRPQ